MPVLFFAIFTHTPSESAWLASSHASHSAAVAKAIACWSSAATDGTLTSDELRRRRRSEGHELSPLPHLDLARRLHGRPEPEPPEPDRRGRDAAARVCVPHRVLAPPARPGRRRARRRL